MSHDEHDVHLPSPTVWPATIGAGLALAAFGVATSYFFTALGALLIARGLAGWIEDIRHEQ